MTEGKFTQHAKAARKKLYVLYSTGWLILLVVLFFSI